MYRKMLVMVGFVTCAGLIWGCAKKEQPKAPPKAASETAKAPEAKAEKAAGQEKAAPVFNPSTLLASIDKNGDGKITREEYGAIWKDAAKAESNFKALDKNGDGVISGDELAALAQPK